MIRKNLDARYQAICVEGAIVESVSRDRRVIEVARAINIHNTGVIFDTESAANILAEVREDHNVEPEIVQKALSLNGKA